MTTTTRIMTADELLMMPSRNLRHELVNGELRSMAPASFGHGVIAGNIAMILSTHAKKHGLGVVLIADTGFVLRQDPDTVRAPDVAFVGKTRIPSGPHSMQFWQGAPDLAVEVISPSDTLEEVEEKVDEYLAAGTQMVLVANPKRRTITVHRPGTNPVVLRDDEILDASPVLPDLKFAVRDAFA